jgi:hypothetical protein
VNAWDDLLFEMQLLPPSEDTEERLSRGAVPPDDAPPEYVEVARVLRAAAFPGTPRELAGERQAVVTIANVVRSRRRGATPITRRRSPMHAKIRLTLAVAALVLATAGLAVAAGGLPGAADGNASDALEGAGVTVPGPDEHAGTNPEGSSIQADQGTGEEVSDLATTTDAEGVEKGAEIASEASGGASEVGTDTADEASGGASEVGTDTADEASGGASEVGTDTALGAVPDDVSAPDAGGTGTADEASGGSSVTGTDTGDDWSAGDSSGGSRSAP